METCIHSLRMVKLWAYTKSIEDKGATATGEELATYLEACEVLRQNDWSYARTMQVLDAVIQGWELGVGLHEAI